MTEKYYWLVHSQPQTKLLNMAWLCDHDDDDDNSDVVRAACYTKHSPSHLSHAIPIKNMTRRKRFSVKEKMLMIDYEWLVCFCFPCFLFVLIDWLFGIRFINWVSIDPITFGLQAIKMLWLLILYFNPLNNPPGVFLIKKEEILVFFSKRLYYEHFFGVLYQTQ